MSMLKPSKASELVLDATVGGNPLKPSMLVYDPTTKSFQTAPPQEPKPQGNKGTGEKRGKYRPKKKIGVGTIFGNLIVRRKLSPRKDVIPNLRIQFRCECTAVNFEGKRCGRIIDVPRYYLLRKSNPKTDCGCTVQTLASKYKREKQIWQMMNFRTQDPRHESYEHYRSRGITVCEEWSRFHPEGPAKGFENFFKDMGPCPSPQHSLDRVHNERGYYKGNCKWATASSQRLNQGARIGGKTIEEIQAMGLTEEEWIEKVLNDDAY
jgi:hypothetical protein